MKSSKLILALWLGASLWAQTSPQKKPASPPPAANPSLPASPSVPAKPPVAAKPSVPARPGGVSATPPQKARVQSTKKPSGSVAQSSGGKSGSNSRRGKRPGQAQSAKSAGAKSKPGKGHRDPFVSPVVERLRAASTCKGTGRQCLLVGEVVLRGVVHSPSGFIAVVANGEHTYFLRENDPLADGAVERITNDAIVLRERSSDAVGRTVTREVTKKLGVAPAG